MGAVAHRHSPSALLLFFGVGVVGRVGDEHGVQSLARGLVLRQRAESPRTARCRRRGDDVRQRVRRRPGSGLERRSPKARRTARSRRCWLAYVRNWKALPSAIALTGDWSITSVPPSVALPVTLSTSKSVPGDVPPSSTTSVAVSGLHVIARDRSSLPGEAPGATVPLFVNVAPPRSSVPLPLRRLNGVVGERRARRRERRSGGEVDDAAVGREIRRDERSARARRSCRCWSSARRASARSPSRRP